MRYGVILDPGHGDRDHTAGKRSPDGTLIEGEWARDVAARMGAAFRSLGFEVRQTVTGGEDITLKARTDYANAVMKENPDVRWTFISIHANAAGNKGRWRIASGWSVYVSPRTTRDNRRFAQTLYAEAEALGLRGNRSVPECRYWEANFHVLNQTRMPAVLTENLFMDNERECVWLKTEEGKDTIVRLHVKALCEHLGVPYGEGAL